MAGDIELERRLTKLEVTSERDHQQLKTQAVEYERRLHVLNNAHEEALRVLNTYVPREIYSKELDGLRTWKEAIDKWKSTEEGRRSTTVIISGGALLVSVGTFIATFFHR